MTLGKSAKILMVAVCSCSLYLLAVSEELVAGGRKEEVKKYLEELKSSKDPAVKARAIEELGKLGQIQYAFAEEALPFIWDGLKDKNDQVRAASALALGRIGPEGAKTLTTLIDLMKNDKVEKVRISAVQGITALGTRGKEATSDIRMVMRGLKDKKSKFGKVLKNALKTLNPKD